MKKYLYIYKTELMNNLQYVFNILTGFIGYFIILFIFLNLWKYIYENPNELINGYSMNQMIWYIIITEILWSTVGGSKLCKKIIEDVKGGNIAYNINKPYNYIGYCLFSHLGEASIRGLLYIIAGITIGYIFLGSFPNLNIIKIICVLITGILATTISTLLIISIGLLAFKIEDSNPFYWIYSKLILVIGTIFPIEYFPKTIQPLVTISPVFVVCYGPAKLFVDFSYQKLLLVLVSQIIYIILSYSLCTLIYKKGVKNLNVNGG